MQLQVTFPTPILTRTARWKPATRAVVFPLMRQLLESGPDCGPRGPRFVGTPLPWARASAWRA